jgi:RNA-directed DNA polymerase
VSGHWFKPRGYKHLDSPVSEGFVARACDREFVASHDWSPLIHYFKSTKRYKVATGKTVLKERPIMYASHRDACILSKYANDLTTLLDAHYVATGLDASVIAYRQLGRANYNFAADAYKFALSKSPCVVMCFDVTGFFDHLDHSVLKNNLKRILQVTELPPDWYAVFKQVAKFRAIEKADLAGHPVFGPRLDDKSRAPVATISEVKAANIKIRCNPDKYGIPQGTPISAAFSNLYMLDFDRALVDACAKADALYQRYSDDILIVCSPEDASALHALVQSSLAAHKLSLSTDKTEIVNFGTGPAATFQYLGFEMSPSGAVVRASSMSRQWRKLKRNIRRTKENGEKAIQDGTATKIFTKKLRKRFSPVGARNFSSYARRAANAFDSEKLVSQVRRLERAADVAIRNLNK